MASSKEKRVMFWMGDLKENNIRENWLSRLRKPLKVREEDL